MSIKETRLSRLLLQLIPHSQKTNLLAITPKTYQTSPLTLSIQEIKMKFSVAILTGLLISCASAYRIDVWDKPDFQGTQRAYVCGPLHS